MAFSTKSREPPPKKKKKKNKHGSMETFMVHQNDMQTMTVQ